MPEQRLPEQQVPEQRLPEQRRSEDSGSGPEPKDLFGVDFGIDAIEPAEREMAGPNRLAGLFSGLGRAVGRRLARLGLALVVIVSRDWLEAIAVLVQGVGGAIFPPIWFMGALIVTSSRKWDLRDKWLGLGVPVLAVMVGATLTIVLGGQRSSLGSYAFEGWLAAGRLSRLAALLGALYLLWRLHRGLREPRVPPWSAARKRG